MNTLKDDELVHIFEYINPREYGVLMQVNKKWREILELPCFTKKFVLSIKNCVISPQCEPWTVLKESTRLFTTIKFGTGIKFGNRKCCIEFCKVIGRAITKINFDDLQLLELSPDKWDLEHLFEQFPKLKTIDGIPYTWLMSCSLPSSVASLCNVPTIRPNWFPTHAKIPQLNAVKEFTAKSVTVVRGMKTVFKISDEIATLTTLKYHQFNLILKPINILGKEINFECIQGIKLTNGSMNFESELRQWLEKCPLLQELEIITSESTCFFLHETVYAPAVERVTITEPYNLIMNDEQSCDTCWDYLMESFPNLTALDALVNTRYINSILALPWKANQNLKVLDLTLSKRIEELIIDSPQLEVLTLRGASGQIVVDTENLDDFLLEITDDRLMLKALCDMPQLHTINVDGYVRLDSSALVDLMQYCRNLRHIVFEYNLSIPELMAITDYCGQVQELTVHLCKTSDEKEKLGIIGKKLTQLKVLRIGPFPWEDYESQSDIRRNYNGVFKTIPSLRVLQVNEQIIYNPAKFP